MVTFQSIVKKFLREVQFSQGTLNSFNKLIQDEIRRLEQNRFKGNIPPFISYSHLVISDLTGPTESGWEINLSSGFDRKIKFEDYETELNRILIRECAFSIAQCYERLETFIKNSLALHLSFNSPSSTTFHKALTGLHTYSEFKKGVRNIRSKDNKDLFKVLRKSCPFYQGFEKQNNFGCNLYEWYKVYSLVRHAITHQSSIVSESQFNKLTSFQLELLKFYFPGTVKGQVYYIEIQISDARKTIKRVAEFGFTIFKSLSIHNHKPWNILKK